MPVTGLGASAEVDAVTSLVTALNAATTAATSATASATAATAALSSRQVIAGTGLTGGGTLAADRTFTVDFVSSGTSSSTKAVRADDSRLSDTRTPAAGSVSSSTLASGLLFTGGISVGAASTSGWVAAGGGIWTTGTINAGNLATGLPAAFGKTRGLNVEIGMSSAAGDVEDIHGALILGSLSGIGVGATHKQVFGAEIQGQTNNSSGIGADSIVGVNALAVHMSDTTIASGRYVAGLVGTPQFGNVLTPGLVGGADLAVGILGNAVTLFTPGWTITKAVSVYAKDQTTGTFNAGIYSEGDVVTASGANVGVGLGFTAPTTALQVVGAISLGSGSASNSQTGDILGITRLVFGSLNGNNAGNRVFVVSNVFTIQGGSSGFSFNSPTNTKWLQLTSGGSVITSAAALSTSATDGFLYIPTCAGTPSGTPTSQTGTVPIVYDTTNHKLYAYDGGWKTTTVFA